jgi:hypothetical protein
MTTDTTTEQVTAGRVSFTLGEYDQVYHRGFPISVTTSSWDRSGIPDSVFYAAIERELSDWGCSIKRRTQDLRQEWKLSAYSATARDEVERAWFMSFDWKKVPFACNSPQLYAELVEYIKMALEVI